MADDGNGGGAVVAGSPTGRPTGWTWLDLLRLLMRPCGVSRLILVEHSTWAPAED